MSRLGHLAYVIGLYDFSLSLEILQRALFCAENFRANRSFKIEACSLSKELANELATKNWLVHKQLIEPFTGDDIYIKIFGFNQNS